MSDDYGFAGKRRSKNDKRKKRLHNLYKRGGKFRSASVEEKEKET